MLTALLFSFPRHAGDFTRHKRMGENYLSGDRNGVRTPMQWSADKNAGFFRGESPEPFPATPPHLDPENHYKAVNVDVRRATRILAVVDAPGSYALKAATLRARTIDPASENRKKSCVHPKYEKKRSLVAAIYHGLFPTR